MHEPVPQNGTTANVTVVILTRDEELHIARAMASVSGFADRIVVVDSGSTDATVSIARAQGAVVLRREWRGYADQFNWALAMLPPDTQWVLRLDADEIVDAALAAEITRDLASTDPDVAGIVIGRRMTFQRQPIRFGGVAPSRSVRLFRYGQAHIEARWMDEHVICDGRLAVFKGSIVDDNLKPLTWWIEKHNRYASREAADLLRLEHADAEDTGADASCPRGPAGRRRWLKHNIYARLPGGWRALGYIAYRLIIRLGVLDGGRGIAFHVLQGFWYRYLVDVKIAEVKRHMRVHDVDLDTAIGSVFALRGSTPTDTIAQDGSRRNPAANGAASLPVRERSHAA